MPIKFITLSETYTKQIEQYGFEAFNMKIEDYIPRKNVSKTYYVSPANSLCFMDGGIDYALSRIIFPGIEFDVKELVRKIGITSIVGKPYLPIGSSIIFEKENNKSLVIAPTMLLPQNVSNTKNAYYATMAILYNILINKNENLEHCEGSIGFHRDGDILRKRQSLCSEIENVDILFTSFCCGYGKMSETESIQQILDGIRDYTTYIPTYVEPNIVIHEPNLHSQPKYYQNTEFFVINPEEIVKC